MTWLDILGYAGSLCVALAMTMRSVIRLRYAAFAGSLAFVLYGALVPVYPVLCLNLFTAAANLFYILRIRRSRDYFELLKIRRLDNRFLRRFLEFHHKDIARFFPHFRTEDLREPVVLFILRNLLPVGLVIFEPRDEETWDVKLDYVSKEYRDLKSAHHFYSEWNSEVTGVSRVTLIATSSVPEHVRYLLKVGFQPDGERGEGVYTKTVGA